MYIKVIEDKYAIAADSCLGNLLGSFIVNDYRDRQLLMEYFKDRCQPPTIYICQFYVSAMTLL